MKTFAEKIAVLVQKGYLEDAARAKVAHDAVLMAMGKAGFESSSTIKGGVVLSHITADIRRTTMDGEVMLVSAGSLALMVADCNSDVRTPFKGLTPFSLADILRQMGPGC